MELIFQVPIQYCSFIIGHSFHHQIYPNWVSFSLWPRHFILFDAIINRNCPLLGRRHWQPTPVLLPGESHGRRNLVGYSPWGHEELDTTERLHFHFSLSCIGEGSGNPLQCSCLENPRESGTWWAATYGVTQSLTWLKWLSSSSPLYSSPVGYWTPSNLGVLSSNVIYFCLFILSIGFSR